MRCPSKHDSRLPGFILVLVGLLIVVIGMPEPVGRISAQIVGSSWSVTGSLNKARFRHTATLLRNGKVLVAGGYNYSENEGSRGLNSAELYDPITGKWTETGHLNWQRAGHKATLLADGKVLVIGGIDTNRVEDNSAELYDPNSGTWSVTGNFIGIPPPDLQTIVLPNGKVFIRVPDGTETYDPATGKWRYEPLALPQLRIGHTTTLLADGRVMAAGGGYFKEITDEIISDGSVELYDRIIGFPRGTGYLLTPRFGHTATRLPTGKVLVTGGEPPYSGILRSAELYDPLTGTWSAAGNIPKPIHPYSTTLLSNSEVLISGFDNDENLIRLHLYNPATGSWNSGGNLPSRRFDYTATLLPNGRVLFAGGYHSNDIFNIADNVAELYDLGLPPVGTVVSVSAASFSFPGLASEAIASAFGTDLSTATSTASVFPPSTQLAGTTLKVKDSMGAERLAPLFFVSPTQVNYLIPPGTAAGAASLTITRADGKTSTGIALLNQVAPSLFAANGNGQGVAAALALRLRADGSQSYEPIEQFDAAQNKYIARPLDLGPASDQVYLVLFGTGIRHRSSLSTVIASIGGAYAEVSYAGAQPDLIGVDQVNVLVPHSLAGRGEVDVLLTVEAQMANPVRIQIK